MTETYWDASYPPSVLNPPEPPPPNATGATAGTPGTWTPAGSTPPAGFAQLVAWGVVADPATAWPEGTYVVCGDGAECSWVGDRWVGNRAPAPDPEPEE